MPVDKEAFQTSNKRYDVKQQHPSGLHVEREPKRPHGPKQSPSDLHGTPIDTQVAFGSLIGFSVSKHNI